MSEKSPEDLILDLDWNEMSEKDRSEFVLRHAVYVELVRRRVHVRAVYGADVRSLLVSLGLVFVLSMLRIETTTIIMALLAVQAFFTVASRLLSFFVDAQVDETRVDYIEFLKRKRKKDE